jgi:hypothetical protein
MRLKHRYRAFAHVATAHTLMGTDTTTLVTVQRSKCPYQHTTNGLPTQLPHFTGSKDEARGHPVVADHQDWQQKLQVQLALTHAATVSLHMIHSFMSVFMSRMETRQLLVPGKARCHRVFSTTSPKTLLQRHLRSSGLSCDDNSPFISRRDQKRQLDHQKGLA